MKNIFVFVALALMLAINQAFGQTTVQFFLGDFIGNAVANRNVQVLNVSLPGVNGNQTVINNIGTFTTDGSGFFGLTNVAPGLYVINVMAPPQRTSFQVLVTATNLGVVNANTILAAASTATFPSASVAWAAAVSDARYARNSNSLGTLSANTPGVSVSGGANTLQGGNAVITVTNLPEVYISNLVSDLAAQSAYTLAVSNYAFTVSNSLSALIYTIGSNDTNYTIVTSNSLKATILVISNQLGLFSLQLTNYSSNYVQTTATGLTNLNSATSNLLAALIVNATNAPLILKTNSVIQLTQLAQQGAANGQVITWNNSGAFWTPSNAPSAGGGGSSNASNVIVAAGAHITVTSNNIGGNVVFTNSADAQTNGVVYTNDTIWFDPKGAALATGTLLTNDVVATSNALNSFVVTTATGLTNLNSATSNLLAALIVASTNTAALTRTNTKVWLNQLDGSMASAGQQMIYSGSIWQPTNRWVGSNILYVATNGVDATARLGDRDFPWRTPGIAISNATAGQTVFLLPGNFRAEGGAVTVPDGVTVQGSGQDVSVMSFIGQGTPELKLRKNQFIQDLTINSGAIGNDNDPNTYQPYQTNNMVRRVTINGGSDALIGITAKVAVNMQISSSITNQLGVEFRNCKFNVTTTSFGAATLAYGWFNILPSASTNLYITNSYIRFYNCDSTLSCPSTTGIVDAPNLIGNATDPTPTVWFNNCNWLMTNASEVVSEGGDNQITFTHCSFKMDSRPKGTGVIGDYVLISTTAFNSQPGFSRYLDCTEEYYLTSLTNFQANITYQAPVTFVGGVNGNGTGLTNLDLSKQQPGTLTSSMLSNYLAVASFNITSNLTIGSYGFITTRTNWIYMTGEGAGLYELTQNGQWTNRSQTVWSLNQSGGNTFERSNGVSIWSTPSVNLFTNTWSVVGSSGSSPTSIPAPQLTVTGVPILGTIYSTNLSYLLNNVLTNAQAYALVVSNALAAGVGQYTITNDSRALNLSSTLNLFNGTFSGNLIGGPGSSIPTNTAAFTENTNELVSGQWNIVPNQRARVSVTLVPTISTGGIVYSNALTGQLRTNYWASGVTNTVELFLQPNSQYAVTNATVVPNTTEILLF